MSKLATHLLTLSTATLGSSCCLIQLLLNALGFGCAGFAVLTPYQPLFAALSVTCLGYSIHRNRSSTAVKIAVSALLILLSPYLLAYFNLVGLSSGKEFITGEVRGAKCEGCLNSVKNRLGALENITGVSAQFQRDKSDLQIADVSISASYPISQIILQEALKAEHKLKVISRVSVASDINLPSHLIRTWVVTYTNSSNEPFDESAITLNQKFVSSPHVLHVSVFYEERQHTIVASSSFDPEVVRKIVSQYTKLTVENMYQK